MRCLVILSVFFFLVDSTAIAQSSLALLPDRVPLVIHTNRGIVRYDIEIACTAEERAQGLMYRHHLPVTRAMLFVFPQEQELAMWMADTPLSLDILFIDHSGQILHLYKDAEPFSRTVIPSVYPVSFVLETSAGQIRKKGITTGQKVVHPALYTKYAICKEPVS